MSAKLLKGRALARRWHADLGARTAQRRVHTGQGPRIAAVLIGDDRDARGYARAQSRACRRAGVEYELHELPDSTDRDQAVAALKALNADPAVSGIILLTPVPAHLEDAHLNWYIDPNKDIDGAHPTNLGRLAANAGTFFVPATPAAGLALLDDLEPELAGRNAVVIGRSNIVGKPLALSLLHRHCTVTLAHSRTRNLNLLAAQADILCVAVGQPHMITSEFVQPGAIVLDFGTTYLESGVVGDCEPESVCQTAGWFTPVPGGIGPLTNAMLIANAIRAFDLMHSI